MDSMIGGMKLIDNVNQTLRDDLSEEIKAGSKLSIAAACFSIYAFSELQKELKKVDELRFIFTSPTFIKERATKEQIKEHFKKQGYSEKDSEIIANNENIGVVAFLVGEQNVRK